MRITPYFGLISLLPCTTPVWLSLIAGVLVVLSLSLSMYLVFEHFSVYKNPEEQKFLIGVIFMDLCYAVKSFVSLTNISITVNCEILRDCYGSFAMYCFGRYLVVLVLGDYSADCPLDHDDIRDSERPTKPCVPLPDNDIWSGMTI